MRTKDKISRFVDEQGSASAAELSRYLGISRQAVNGHMRVLIDAAFAFSRFDHGDADAVFDRAHRIKIFELDKNLGEFGINKLVEPNHRGVKGRLDHVVVDLVAVRHRVGSWGWGWRAVFS